MGDPQQQEEDEHDGGRPAKTAEGGGQKADEPKDQGAAQRPGGRGSGDVAAGIEKGLGLFQGPEIRRRRGSVEPLDFQQHEKRYEQWADGVPDDACLA